MSADAPVVIRRGDRRDLAAVARIEHASFDDPWSDEALLSEIEADAMRLPLVAECGGQVCGFQAVAGGLVEVTLEVRASNHGARAFYRRHGFAETGLRPGYYSDNGEDAVIMTAACAAILAGG